MSGEVKIDTELLVELLHQLSQRDTPQARLAFAQLVKRYGQYLTPAVR